MTLGIIADQMIYARIYYCYLVYFSIVLFFSFLELA